MNYTNPTLKPAASTTIGVKIDRLLDEISFLKDKLALTIYMVDDLMVAYLDSDKPEVAFDLSEIMLVLVETRIDSDLRRFPVADEEDPVLASSSTETKEEQ
jgi:hypothetical protein